MLRRNAKSEDVDHNAVIQSIAQEMHYPIPVVKRVFETEFARIKAAARIEDYVILFASRRTRAELLAGHALSSQ
jgi:hypothetical protein